LGNLLLREIALGFYRTLLHPTAVGNQYAHESRVAHGNQFHVLDACPAERGILHHGHLIGELRKESHGVREEGIDVVGFVEHALDGEALRTAECLDVGEVVDKDAVSPIGGDASARRVWGGDE
jgi:hypothetical protein